MKPNCSAHFFFVMVFAIMVQAVFAQVQQPGEIWDGSTYTSSWYTNNPSANEFTITTAQQLRGLASLVNNGNTFVGKTIKLGANIMVNDTANWRNWATTQPANKNWQMIGGEFSGGTIGIFNGTFDGNGFVVSGIYMYYLNNYLGLFGIVGPDGIIKNLGVKASYIRGSEDENVGGLIGYNLGTINNSYSMSTVTGEKYVGGLVGMNAGTINNSYSTGAVTGKNYIGGLAGYNLEGDINSSHSTGAVTGTDYIGGLVGVNSGAISVSYSTGTVIGTGDETGGLVGYNFGTINVGYSTGAVTGVDNVGGFVGTNIGTINVGYSTGAVRGANGRGWVGISYGGFAGYNYGGKIFGSYSTGAVSGGTTLFYTYKGGFVGQNSNLDYKELGNLLEIILTEGTTPPSGIGGWIGEKFGTVIGGNGTIKDCYYDLQTSNQDEGIGIGTGNVMRKTTSEMKTKATFYNWDFNVTWGINSTINNNYPYLLRFYEEKSASYHIFAYRDKDAENRPTTYSSYVAAYVYNGATASNPKDEYSDGISGFAEGVAKLWNINLAAPDDYSGAGINIANKTSGSPSLADCKEVSYYYKGDPHWFLLEFPKSLCTTPSKADDNKWGLAVTPAQANWTKKTINLTTLKLARSWEDAGCGGGNLNAVPIDLTKVMNLQWAFDDNVNNGLSKNLMIANVACITTSGGTIADSPPPSDITFASGWESPSSSSNAPSSSSLGGASPIISDVLPKGLTVLFFDNVLRISSAQKAKVQLFDMHGSIALNMNFAAGNNILNLEKQKKGVYYAVVQSGSHKQTVKVVVK